MKCATFNTNSIRARLPIILEWLKREQPDILCVQETKVQDKDFPAAPFQDAGYSTVFRGQKSYNGVAVLSKKHAADIVFTLTGETEEPARFIRCRIGDTWVINVYVPQGFAVGSEKFTYKLRWLNELLIHIHDFFTPDQPLIVAGDFNVALEEKDVYDPEGLRGEVGFHPDEQALMERFFEWGLVDLLRKHHPEEGQFTFWDYRIPNALKRKMGWRVDYILATPPLADTCRDCWIDTGARSLPKPSDHTFLVAEFDLP
ncbi:MAG: exodeoxyribonuclease III [Thermoplasmata archaeon]|nr:MAG: exodeoxyribonuclease III [Deltaproteobacteria bacterium]RLF61619.1 MAG: exodeoxyribonuclease III [Thermoplasmata archaeon]HDZ23552.1 exodeoxyribonuclease III [Desulfobacteraceae bacterium]